MVCKEHLLTDGFTYMGKGAQVASPDEGARAKLLVMGMEVGGRWSSEAWHFVRLLASAKARSEPEVLRRLAALAWQRRWVAVLCMAAQRAFAESLLELPGAGGADGPLLSAADVLEDARYELGPLRAEGVAQRALEREQVDQPARAVVEARHQLPHVEPPVADDREL